ncbi:hypothetical protein G7043_45740 [Lentzea sp. NEAU-D13]|uniref:Uncharacterized protein n=1 Tax=Lentzea alba TaxID=2714351 RepID=A0A7C9VW53_9PSEU|nr:hypothetical protein [Lentzea alba]NGY66214.1 hypothetical protein [Lentzea alba]
MNKSFGGKTLAVVAVAGGALLASVSPVMAQVSTQSPSNLALQVESPAKTETLGAVLKVKVTYACPAGYSGGLNLQVTEAVAGGRIAWGSADVNVDCTGESKSVTVTLAARDNAFRKGIAYAQASMGVPMVGTAKDEREITIVS